MLSVKIQKFGLKCRINERAYKGRGYYISELDLVNLVEVEQKISQSGGNLTQGASQLRLRNFPVFQLQIIHAAEFPYIVADKNEVVCMI